MAISPPDNSLEGQHPWMDTPHQLLIEYGKDRAAQGRNDPKDDPRLNSG